ncbi:MAG: ABC transporter permease [Microbacteriaceae bacterium]
MSELPSPTIDERMPRPGTGTGTGTGRGLLRSLLTTPLSGAGLVVLLVLVLVAALGPVVAPYGVNATDVLDALQPPSPAHWFGTDDLGRDVLTRVMLAARVSLQVALVSVTFALVVGTAVGLVSGYLGGWVDTVLMRAIDVMFAFPVLLLALAIVAILGPGLTTAMLAIGVVYTPIFARVTRASTLSITQEPYVKASRAMGTRRSRILVRHILPNISGPLIVQTSLSLAFAILSEAALSFLGLGVQPPQPSWGRMLFDAQGFLSTAWWLSVFPGAAIFVTVLAFNLVGDGLRDVLDPRHRTRTRSRSTR